MEQINAYENLKKKLSGKNKYKISLRCEMQTSIISVIGNRCPCMRSPREKKTYFFFYHQENYLHGEANVDMTVKEKKRKREKKKKRIGSCFFISKMSP